MHEHRSLREHLAALWGHGNGPIFEASNDRTLVAFGQLFAESQLFTFDANKHLRTDALTPIYDCETESRQAADTEPDTFVVSWAPVWQRDNPVTGFRTGSDSTVLGSTPTIAMPQDERTAALLLLVTSAFVHLSASRQGSAALVQGAAEAENGTYRYLTLAPEAVPAQPEGSALGQASSQ
jgi:hypothetical protein